MRGKPEVFVRHIRDHLDEGHVVVCRICDRTIDEIYNLYRGEILGKDMDKPVNSHADVFDAVRVGLDESSVSYKDSGGYVGVSPGVFRQEYEVPEYFMDLEEGSFRTKLVVESKFPGGPVVSFMPKFEVVVCTNGLVGRTLSDTSLSLILNRTPLSSLAQYARYQAELLDFEASGKFMEGMLTAKKDMLTKAEEVIRRMIEAREWSCMQDRTMLSSEKSIGDRVCEKLEGTSRWDIAMALSSVANDYAKTYVPVQFELQRLAYGVVLEPKAVIPVALAY